jgi:hypothetical protein
VSLWFLPAAILSVGCVLIAVRAWGAWGEAQALVRSLVALRTLQPQLRALAEERVALAARLDGIRRHPLVSSAPRR